MFLGNLKAPTYLFLKIEENIPRKEIKMMNTPTTIVNKG